MHENLTSSTLLPNVEFIHSYLSLLFFKKLKIQKTTTSSMLLGNITAVNGCTVTPTRSPRVLRAFSVSSCFLFLLLLHSLKIEVGGGREELEERWIDVVVWSRLLLCSPWLAPLATSALVGLVAALAPL